MKRAALVIAAVICELALCALVVGALYPLAVNASEQERIAQRRAAWKAGHVKVAQAVEPPWWYDEQPCMTRCDWCDETVNEATDRAVKAERELAEAKADLARIKADIEGFVTARGLSDEFYEFRMARERLRWAKLTEQKP